MIGIFKEYINKKYPNHYIDQWDRPGIGTVYSLFLSSKIRFHDSKTIGDLYKESYWRLKNNKSSVHMNEYRSLNKKHINAT